MRITTTLKPCSGKLDIAAMIDVVFLLLIFFVLSSSLVFHPGIPVELPRTRVSDLSSAEKIIITITASGDLFFNDNHVEWEQLEQQLTDLAYASKQLGTVLSGGADAAGETEGKHTPKVLLRADKHVPYERIMDVMSLARSLKLGVYLATDLPPRNPVPIVTTD